MGAMNILKTVDLIGRDGVLSKSSPGVFIQVCNSELAPLEYSCFNTPLE